MTFTYLFSQVKYFITWYRKFTLCKASKNATNSVETETSKRTWDMWQKDFDPSLHKNMSPFWWTKKGDFFTPLPPVWTNVSFSAIFFFGRHPLLSSGVFKSFDEEQANALRIIILHYNIFLSDVTFNVMIHCLWSQAKAFQSLQVSCWKLSEVFAKSLPNIYCNNLVYLSAQTQVVLGWPTSAARPWWNCQQQKSQMFLNLEKIIQK